MKTNLKLFLSLLGILSLTVGCITLGAKKAAQSKAESTAPQSAAASDSATTYKTVDEYLKRVGSTCPKVLENMSQNPNPNRFSYILDTTDTPACRVARSIEDLIGDGRLFELSQYNEIKQDRGGKYHQYHKGILVEDTEIRLREKTRTGKIYKIKGGYYPALNVDTTRHISKEAALDIAIEKSGFYELKKEGGHTNWDVEKVRAFTNTYLIISPLYNKLVYIEEINHAFEFGGRYYIDAFSGEFLHYAPSITAHLR